MKTLDKLLDRLELEDIDSSYGLNSLILNIRNNSIIRQIIICILNIPDAPSALVYRMGEWLRKDDDGMGEVDFDGQIAASLLALIDSNCVEAEFIAEALLETNTLPSSALIANNYILHKEVIKQNKH